jgi:hypothetical protein
MNRILQTLLLTFILSPVFAQCNWETVLFDSYEYQTVVPHLIPGATVHNTPKSYAVFSGNFSLYMNMTNCNGGVGTCAGDTVYVRPMAVCPQLPVQISSQLTTSFTGGQQCNVHLTVMDANGTILNDQDSIAADFYPQWTTYTTGTIIPQTDTIIFILITNVNGGNGNDLSMDDFHLERCIVNAQSSYTAQLACSNGGPIDLFNVIPGSPDTSGAWNGPSGLGGGYAGTFTPFVNSNGTYVYHSAPYGTNSGCPQFDDSVNVTVVLPPVPELGTDTTYCTGTQQALNPGTNPAFTYLWSDGSNQPILVVGSANPDTNTYSVTVTDLNGCSATDSVTVIFEICAGIEDQEAGTPVIYPNPTSDNVYLEFAEIPQSVSLFDCNGKLVRSVQPEGQTLILNASELSAGTYLIRYIMGNGSEGSSRIHILQ